MIAGNPTTLKETIRIASKLTDELVKTGILNNQTPETENRQDTETMESRGRVTYLGTDPRCNLCSLHHQGQCPACETCGRTGHLTRSCRRNNKRPRTCPECGEIGHRRRKCPKRNRALVTHQERGTGRIFAPEPPASYCDFPGNHSKPFIHNFITHTSTILG